MKPKTTVIHALIENSRHSYKGAADYVGCHKSMIGALATDPKKTCGPVIAQKLAVLLGVPIDVLFDVVLPTSTGRVANQNRKAA